MINQITSNNKQYISLYEAEKIIGVKWSTIWKWVHQDHWLDYIKYKNKNFIGKEQVIKLGRVRWILNTANELGISRITIYNWHKWKFNGFELKMAPGNQYYIDEKSYEIAKELAKTKLIRQDFRNQNRIKNKEIIKYKKLKEHNHQKLNQEKNECKNKIKKYEEKQNSLKLLLIRREKEFLKFKSNINNEINIKEFKIKEKEFDKTLFISKKELEQYKEKNNLMNRLINILIKRKTSIQENFKREQTKLVVKKSKLNHKIILELISHLINKKSIDELLNGNKERIMSYLNKLSKKLDDIQINNLYHLIDIIEDQINPINYFRLKHLELKIKEIFSF